MDKGGDNLRELWKTMFLGEYQYKIDDKKRVAVPADFRKKLGQKPVITRGLDNCLFLYPRSAWEKLAKKISELPLAQSDARRFARIMLAGAMEVSIDKAGRILLPDYLKDYASLEKNVTVAGVYDRVEVWDADIWEKYKHKIETEAGEIAERLKELGV